MTPNTAPDETYYGTHAATIASRDGTYGPIVGTYDTVAAMWHVLTDGAPVADTIDVMLLWTLTKLVRFWNSGKRHRDSIHDAGGYISGIESAVADEAAVSERFHVYLRDSEATDAAELLSE